MTATLDDLIESGVKLYKARREAEARARAQEQERLIRERQVAEQAVLSLLPESLRELAEVDLDKRAGVWCGHVNISLPQGGKCSMYVEKSGDTWTIKSSDDYYYISGTPTYEAYNPSGYYCRFFNLEEAVAYAAGAIHE